MIHRALRALAGLAALALAACGGGASGPSAGSVGIGVGPVPCSGRCQDTPTRLTVADVEQIIAQGVQEAQARSSPATIVVIDRVGNVLAAYQMAGAPTTIRITSGTGASGGIDGVEIVPSELGAIAKALTGAYFSSEGNAFSTRTANQIIQEHFNLEERFTPGGPLFGVQISQLPCSDISRRYNGVGVDPGPHRSPIGFAADPGGLPLYKNGTVVGAVAVIADGIYGLVKDDVGTDRNLDELIAVAATWGFGAPRDRRADIITLDAKTLRYANVDFGDLLRDPATAPPFAAIPPGVGSLLTIRGYADPVIRAGTAFGQADSGIRPASLITEPELAAVDGFVLVDEFNARRFPPINGTDGLLTQQEVKDLLSTSVALANRTRSQVRRPFGASAGIHVVVVDTNGAVVGVARTRDALVDATDVTVQKARTSILFSAAGSGTALQALPDAEYLAPGPAVASLRTESIGQYVTAFRTFFNQPTGLDDGAFAWSTRAVGNISRPFFPDGIDGNPPGPLSKPAGEWSIFSTGLELDLVYNAVIRHIAFVVGLAPTDVGIGCTGYQGITAGFEPVQNPIPKIANGITLFAGGFPIYRGGTLIGAIGLSGDGLEQDDFLPFLANDAVGKLPGGSIGNAPKAIRADQLRVGDVNLRYLVCPFKPFLDSNEQNVCTGL
ncbi:heme-binding protein [Solimonas sp. SE-A11]|uniref:GlcG/HbpS family heme-binding protein n=1 Tax=Solimonas sp. SE-A11 TaxID=3054954 RepID=UPI00259C9540|nr:heme-binding protein [Solimonas sp. SE-A11]MDM4770394.1 heme-binding protein [Solimonas sp. SE-A11]